MKIIEVNKASCKLWNCLANEFYGKHVLDLFSVQEREKYLKNVEVGIKSGSVDQFETVVLTSDKIEVPVEIKGKLLKDKSGIVELLLTVRDITVRIEKELRFAENKNKHRLLFESLKGGYAFHKIILDEKGTPIDYVFLDINPVFETFNIPIIYLTATDNTSAFRKSEISQTFNFIAKPFTLENLRTTIEITLLQTCYRK